MNKLFPLPLPNAKLSSKTFKRGSIILYQSEVPRAGYVITSGLVHVYAINSSGDERIIRLHVSGDLFPLSWLSGDISSTLFYYEAATDVTVQPITRKDFNDAVESDPSVAVRLLHSALKEDTALTLRITALEQSTAAEKIAMTLYYLLMRHGEETSPHHFTISLKLTQSMLANLVGLTRESTAVNLKTLKRKDIVRYKNFVYTVRKDLLESYIGEDSFKDVDLH